MISTFWTETTSIRINFVNIYISLKSWSVLRKTNTESLEELDGRLILVWDFSAVCIYDLALVIRTQNLWFSSDSVTNCCSYYSGHVISYVYFQQSTDGLFRRIFQKCLRNVWQISLWIRFKWWKSFKNKSIYLAFFITSIPKITVFCAPWWNLINFHSVSRLCPWY